MADTKVLTPRSIGGLPVQKVQARAETLNLLIYGEPGIGKTVLAGSSDAVPSMRPVLVLDVEGGTESLRRTYPDVETVRVPTWESMLSIYEELASGQHDFQTVVLDSLTEIQKFSMYKIMVDLVTEEPNRDPDVPGMREWGKNIEQVRKLVRRFRDLPMNVIFTALADSDKNPKTGIVTKKPQLSGKLKNEVAGFLDIVMYMYVKEVPRRDGQEGTEQVRLCLTGTTEEYVAKDRTGKLPLILQDPTMKQVHELIHTTE